MADINCACSGCLPLEGGFGRKITNARRLIHMHAVHGHGPEDRKCGECAHLTTVGFNRRYFKCRLSGVTRSDSSDWRKKWEACGMFKTRGIRSES